ncbi:MAG: alginate lyase family protein [Armatimonadota bacterium]|nr:alginate lyase family protein [Armatimonadota bacterium]
MKHNALNRVIFFAAIAITLQATVASAASGTGLTNAAQAKYGARATVDAGPGVVKDKQTGPDAYLDANPHSRYVLTGTPYTINIELAFKVPVEKLSFAHSDYAKEAAPKELEITFDDGQKVRQTLELKRPVKRKAVWQDVPVGHEVQKVKITVLSNYEGEVKWGGLADIAIWTAMNLDEKFRAPGHDPNGPVFIHATSPVAAETTVKVNLPPVAKPGEHPRLLFTPQELTEFRDTLKKSERGPATLATFMGIADNYVKLTPSFPTPEDTAAEKAGKAHGSLSNRVQALGFAYALTGDDKYAKAAREILVGYGQRYASYPRHSGRNKSDSSKVTFQRLSEAMWLIPQLIGYDYIYNSAVLSDDDKKLIESGLIRAAIDEIRRKSPAAEVADHDRKDADWRTKTPEPARQGDFPNWINFYSAATIMAGAIMNDKDMIDLAAADLRSAIARGIGEDGMWGEGAIGYQLFAMNAMSPALETAARQGIDLWGALNGRFKQLFDSPLRYAYPDGTMPGINDSGRGKLGSWQTMVYDYGYLRYGDARYAFLVNETQRQLHTSEGVYQPTRVFDKVPEPPSVIYGSTLFGSLGYAILRDATKYALMDYGPHGGVHGHHDKLNLILFANPPGGKGDEMGGEPVFHFYDNPLHPQWTVQTVAHNTMAVDEKSQMANEGKLLIFEDTPTVKLMRAESAGSYPGVLLDRTVVVTPDAVIDLYHGRSTLEHTWDRTFRYKGSLAGLPAAPADAKPLGQNDGYEHLQVAQQQPATALWQGVWQNETGKFVVALAGAPSQQIILGIGPDKDEMALARQTGKRADFAAVYALDSWNNPVQSARWISTGAAGENGAAAFEMTQQDGTTTRIIVAHSPGEWQAADWKSDARVLYVRQKGEEIQVLLGGGSFAQNGALELRQTAPGNYLAQKKGGKLEAMAEWNPTPQP